MIPLPDTLTVWPKDGTPQDGWEVPGAVNSATVAVWAGTTSVILERNMTAIVEPIDGLDATAAPFPAHLVQIDGEVYKCVEPPLIRRRHGEVHHWTLTLTR